MLATRYSLANNSFCLFFCTGIFQLPRVNCTALCLESNKMFFALSHSHPGHFVPTVGPSSRVEEDSKQLCQVSVQCYFRFLPSGKACGVKLLFTCVTAPSRNTISPTWRDVLVFGGKKCGIRASRVIPRI